MTPTFIYKPNDHQEVSLGNIGFDLGSVRGVTIIACGTSYYAALVAKYWIESLVHIPVRPMLLPNFVTGASMSEGGLALFLFHNREKLLDTLVHSVMHIARNKKSSQLLMFLRALLPESIRYCKLMQDQR